MSPGAGDDGGDPTGSLSGLDGRFVTTTTEAFPSISVLLNWPEALRSRGDGQWSAAHEPTRGR